MRYLFIGLTGLIVTACATSVEDARQAETPIAENRMSERNSNAEIEAFQAGMIDRQFLKFDFNDDGAITPYEHKEYRKAFFGQYFDTDGDKVVELACSREQFITLVKTLKPLHPSYQVCLRRTEENPEWIAELSFDDYFAEVSDWFPSVDSDSDGFITKAEYLAQ